ncbi:MAG: UDP-N-acetylglucosamine--N-acetylmuramyl-(pentapeptide) pyrophosphoryl-undecaprenol [Patescibacteria group bacterium]|nr:UDP-N-acetylglucosamine--N-acetylmuramyl-(pentapeptide) pyrophosphoryl-undecaprenol [Patescibacteria group bacterium]
MVKIVFTGGHHNSALVTLDALHEELSTAERDHTFYWIGKKYVDKSRTTLSPEYIEVTKRNVDFVEFTAGKLFRTRSFLYIWKVIINLVKIPAGFIKAYSLLTKIKPNIIVSFGGYLAVPIAIVGKFMGVKVVTHEQTATFGLANRIIGFIADEIYVTWKKEIYPEYFKKKLIETGLPTRIIDQVGEKFSFKNLKPVMYVSGGKLGSDVINTTIFNSLGILLPKVNLIWSIGSNFDLFSEDILKEYLASHPDNQASIIYSRYFNELEVEKIYRSFHFGLSRSGAHTTYEYAYYAKPSILIPIPWASNQEQLKNAQMLASLGLAEIIQEADFNPTTLIQTVDNVLNKIDRDIYPKSVNIEREGTKKICHEIIKHIQKT